MDSSKKNEVLEKIEQVCGTTDRLALVLSGGDVRRYHQEGHVYRQPVSEHTWRVVVVLLHFFPRASPLLIKTAIYHDVAERYTGDTPAPVKTSHPEIKKVLEGMEKEFLFVLGLPSEDGLPLMDFYRLKCADYIELCITVKYQHGRRASQIYERGVELVREYSQKLPEGEFHRIDTFIDNLSGGVWKA